MQCKLGPSTFSAIPVQWRLWSLWPTVFCAAIELDVDGTWTIDAIELAGGNLLGFILLDNSI